MSASLRSAVRIQEAAQRDDASRSAPRELLSVEREAEAYRHASHGCPFYDSDEKCPVGCDDHDGEAFI